MNRGDTKGKVGAEFEAKPSEAARKAPDSRLPSIDAAKTRKENGNSWGMHARGRRRHRLLRAKTRRRSGQARSRRQAVSDHCRIRVIGTQQGSGEEALRQDPQMRASWQTQGGDAGR